MSRFDTIVIVDWSAAAMAPAKGRADAIWAAVARDGRVEEAEYLGHRLDAEAWLAALFEDELRAGRRVMAGFDFPFGYPRGFARVLTGTDDPFAVWDWLDANIDDGREANNRFETAARLNTHFEGIGPFWGNPLKQDIDGLPRLGSARTARQLPEKRRIEEQLPGAFPVWQLSGAGAVGSQILMGLPVLSRLRKRFAEQISVWPFEPATSPVVLAEVWPSLMREEVAATLSETGGIKDARQVEVLAKTLAALSADDLAGIMDCDATEEGWILGAGHELTLREAYATARTAPPFRNDCFALPPGVNWTPVDEALARLKAGLHCRQPVERCDVTQADGRILAVTPSARRAHPPHANSAVDGYGFAFDTLGAAPHRLKLLDDRAAAGAALAGSVPPGQAVRILTGAILPSGVDTVVLQEDVTVSDGHVVFDGKIRSGANTREAGEDVTGGQPLLKSGRRLTPADLAHLTSAGLKDVAVYKRLRVGVLSTGSELVAADEAERPDQTVDANRPMLLAVLRAWGYDAVDLGIVQDDRDDLRNRLTDAAGRVEAILTSGGASTGDEDHMSALLKSEGAVETWRIAIKPGRPLALGLWNGVPVFGLPGNPVAAFVCTLLFARPALSALAGGDWVEPLVVHLPAAFNKHKKPRRREYLRARLAENGQVEVFASEGSGRISGLSWADGLVELPDGAAEIRDGDLVRYLPFSGFGI